MNWKRTLPPTTRPAEPNRDAAEEAVRLRLQHEENTRLIEAMRREGRESAADAFAKSQLEAFTIVPAERAALQAEYLQALVDDEAHPLAEGSRVANIEVRQSLRPAHILTKELLKNIAEGGRVLVESNGDELETAKRQTTKFAEQRNREMRSDQPKPIANDDAR